MPELTLRDVMTREYVGVSESDSIVGAVRLMRAEGAQTAVVLRGQDPVGTISAADVLDLLADGADPGTATVGDVMREETPSLGPDDAVGDAASEMAAADTDLVLVTDGESVIGTVSTRDVARFGWELVETVEEPEFVENEVDDRDRIVDESYSDQSICEACGSLSRDLANVNGQLLCPDCRSV